MAEVWTTDYIEIFQDRFLKLSGISIVAPAEEMKEKLSKLKDEYLESLERMREAFQKKKKIKYASMVGGVLFPAFCLYLIFSKTISSGLYLLILLGLMVGIPYYIFWIYIPKFYRVAEFFKRYQGAEGRINFALECINGCEQELSSQTIDLYLALEGIDIDEQNFISKIGGSDSQGEFTGRWCTLKLPFEENYQYEISMVKVVHVTQTQIRGKDEEVFKLQRKIRLHEKSELEVVIDEEHYEGFRQFRDRDWKGEEHPLLIENVSAGLYSMGITAGLDLFKDIRTDKLLMILGEANKTQMDFKEVLDLLKFVKTHFLKKSKI